MDNDKKPICLALMQETDRRYRSGHKYRAFVKKSAFQAYLDKFPEMVYSDQVQLILLGGAGLITTTAQARSMPWIMED
jgi:hypothetical protein